MSRRANSIFQLDTINDSHPAIRNLLESILLSFTTTTSLADSDWDSIRKGLEEIIPKLTASTDKIIPYELTIPKEMIRVSKVLFLLVGEQEVQILPLH